MDRYWGIRDIYGNRDNFIIKHIEHEKIVKQINSQGEENTPPVLLF